MEDKTIKFYRYRNLLLSNGYVNLQCQPDIGLQNFGNLQLKSTGVSGDVIAKGDLAMGDSIIPVAIKFFRVSCQYKNVRVGTGYKILKRNVYDPSRFELGNAILLTNLFLLVLKLYTPHITFVLGWGYCDSSYQLGSENKSMCTDNVIDTTRYIVPDEQTCNENYSRYPQCSFRADYNNKILDDTIRYLVVERVHGDMEIWLNTQIEFVYSNKISIENFDYSLASMLLMISYTLYVLDSEIAFIHGDLGPRNVLYAQYPVSDAVWVYHISRENYTFYISTKDGTHPKLWDFSNSYTNIPLSNQAYSYLSQDELHRQPSPIIEDFSILINKIYEILEASKLQDKSQLTSAMIDVINNSGTGTNMHMVKYLFDNTWIKENFTYNPNKNIEYVFSY